MCGEAAKEGLAMFLVSSHHCRGSELQHRDGNKKPRAKPSATVTISWVNESKHLLAEKTSCSVNCGGTEFSCLCLWSFNTLIFFFFPPLFEGN